MTVKKIKFKTGEPENIKKTNKKDSPKKSDKNDAMRKGIYLLPNLFTSSSLFLGFYAIVQVMDGHFNTAAMAVIAAGVCDGLDGKIARLTGTASQFGIEYDSLADLISFGVAPGTMIYMWALRPYGKIGWLAAFLYVICGALRLARFNVQVNTVEKKHFKGLPIPAAAGMVATTILMHYEFGGGGTIKKVIIPIMTYVLAYLMVSNISYLSFKDLDLIKRKPFHTLVFIIILLTVIVAAPELMLFLMTSLYVISGPLGMFKGLLKKKHHVS
jgi:CDP-diacylglycerol--serine O-phosphatidyltransferase